MGEWKGGDERSVPLWVEWVRWVGESLTGGSGGGVEGVLFFDRDLVGLGGTALKTNVLGGWFRPENVV